MTTEGLDVGPRFGGMDAKGGDPRYNKWFFSKVEPMLEINALKSQIQDLQGRVTALRGYL